MAKIITISREFGSGGRELGKRLADELEFDYYDKEIISAIAEKKGLDEKYVERALEFSTWKTMPLTFRHSFSGVSGVPLIDTDLLVAQTQVVEKIAALDRDCIIVGRNADVILEAENPLKIFVCANLPSKLKRCIERMDDGEQISEKELKRNIRTIDKNRKMTREIISEGKWGDRASYHLTVNTSDWEIKELTPAIADFARHYFERAK